VFPSSYLRIYEPLDSFPPQEQARWTAYIESGQRLPSKIVYRDVAFEKNGRVGMLYPLVAEHAFVRKLNGNWLVCPSRLKLRVLVGLLAFRNALPADAAEALVPGDEAERAIQEIESLRENEAHMRAHITSAAWHVPIRWFSAFEDGERILTRESRSVRVRYETELSLAKSRVERAHKILKTAGLPDPVVQAVGELLEWMEEFSAHSLIELDYGSVAHLFTDEQLEGDRSAGEVWACLESLEVGDFEESARRYADLADWWAGPRALENAN
jgi:hypothetical protein